MKKSISAWDAQGWLPSPSRVSSVGEESPGGSLAGSEGLGRLVLQAVQLPLPVIDDAHPGPREQLLAPATVEPHLEGDLGDLPRDRGLGHLGKVDVPEVVDLLLLSPLLWR